MSRLIRRKAGCGAAWLHACARASGSAPSSHSLSTTSQPKWPSKSIVTIKYARGTNGNTALTADGVIRLDGDKKDAIDLHVNLDDLELDDERLRKRTPDDYMELWDLFKPKGRVNVDLRVARPRADVPLTGPPGSTVATSRRFIAIFAIPSTT